MIFNFRISWKHGFPIRHIRSKSCVTVCTRDKARWNHQGKPQDRSTVTAIQTTRLMFRSLPIPTFQLGIHYKNGRNSHTHTHIGHLWSCMPASGVRNGVPDDKHQALPWTDPHDNLYQDFGARLSAHIRYTLGFFGCTTGGLLLVST